MSAAFKSFDWFPHGPKPAHGTSRAVAVAQLLIGLGVGTLFYLAGLRTLGVVVGLIALLIGLVSMASVAWHGRIGRFFGALGHWIGRIIAVVLLTPIFLLGFTCARLYSRLAGSDPLCLRDLDRGTFWLECDRDERKVRHIDAMFATERPIRPKRRLAAVAVSLLLVIILAEAALRVVGFGGSILYVPDVQAGYYPAPDQDTRWMGNTIATNRHGMRAPDRPDAKQPNDFRILMLGDSTLWGGLYIAQDDLYARRLEGHLNQRATGNRVEVWNMGVNAWGPFHKLGYVEQFGTFDADLAIVCLPIKDIHRPLYGLEKLPFFTHDNPPWCGLEEVFFHLVWRYRQSRIGPPTQAELDQQARIGIDAYVTLGRKLRDAGCEVMFEILPSRTAALDGDLIDAEKQWIETLHNALKAEQFEVCFPAGTWKGQPANAYYDDVHLDRLGHELYADYLAKRVSGMSTSYREWRKLALGPDAHHAAEGAE